MKRSPLAVVATLLCLNPHPSHAISIAQPSPVPKDYRVCVLGGTRLDGDQARKCCVEKEERPSDCPTDDATSPQMIYVMNRLSTVVQDAHKQFEASEALISRSDVAIKRGDLTADGKRPEEIEGKDSDFNRSPGKDMAPSPAPTPPPSPTPTQSTSQDGLIWVFVPSGIAKSSSTSISSSSSSSSLSTHQSKGPSGCQAMTVNIVDGMGSESCNQTLQEHRDRCEKNGCTAQGPIQCMIGGSPSNLYAYGAQLRCVGGPVIKP